MKLFFLKDHSLYKIFKTLEKIPNGKHIQIWIDPEHAFFDNERWGRQLQELLEKRGLHAVFVTKTEKAKQFFQRLGFTVSHQEPHRIIKILKLVYLFLFNIKEFHFHAYTKKNYVFYMVFGFELAFIFGILYLLYSLVLPRTIVSITPAHQIEHIIYNFRYYPAGNGAYPLATKTLSIPYRTGFIDYKYTMSLSAENIKHIQHPSQGTVRVINTTPKDFILVRGTRFETSDGIVFTAKREFTLPAQSGNVAGAAIIQVVASEQDNLGILIGSRGNIPKDTKLIIKNLKESYFLKKIYAMSLGQFSGGALEAKGTVTPKDIAALSGKLIAYIKDQKQNIVSQHFSLPNSIFLHFKDLISVEVLETAIQNTQQDNSPYLKGYVVARFVFAYINFDDILSQITTYLKQRSSDKVKLLSIDPASLVFLNGIAKPGSGVFIIPTKISVLQGYDFEKDINGVVDNIKTAIVGKERTKAKELLFTYPEISSAKISVRPPRYTTVTKLKSRIKIEVSE